MSIIVKRLIISTALIALLLAPVVSWAADIYWVHPSGSANWAQCESDTDPESNYCSLSTANSNAAAGDTIYLKGGSYDYSGAVNAIEPSNSGTSGNEITFETASGETPILNKTDGGGVESAYAIYLSGKDYIVIKGITIVDWFSGIAVLSGSDYNEIDSCTLYQTEEVYSYHGINIKYTSTHNWVHDSTLYNWAGASGCREGSDGIKIGGTESVSLDINNTIEDNTFYHCGHTCTEDFGMYNVWRNNVGHNEGWKVDPGGCSISCDPVGTDPGDGKYGHRCFAATGYDSGTHKYNLFEGNRIGHAAANPANNGADGFTLGSPGNIVRYNKVFGSDGPGINLKAYGSGVNGAYNRIYNNTIYKNGRYYSTGFHRSGFEKYSDTKSIGNVIKNNLIYDHPNDFTCAGSGCDFDDWVFASNLCDTANAAYACTALTGNPFAAGAYDLTDMTSTTNPTLELSSSSQAINSGTHLTTVSAVTDQTHITLADALYFQDGTSGSSLSNIQADWIAIGTVDNVAQVSSITYSTNAVTLSGAPASTINQDDHVWLYKDSSGDRVLYGSAPDIGACEYESDHPAFFGGTISGGAIH